MQHERWRLTAVCAMSMLVGLLLVQASLSAGTQARRLCWKLAEGDRLRVHLVQQTKTETAVKGQRTQMTVASAVEMLWKVDRVDADGVIHMTQAFTRLATKTGGTADAEVVYDSGATDRPSPESEPMARSAAALLRCRFAVTMTPRGEIARVDPTGHTGQLLEDAAETSGWKTLLTTAGIRRMLQQAIAVLPESAVDRGDTWRTSRVVATPVGRIEIADTYTYEGVHSEGERKLERFTLRSEPRIIPDTLPGGEAPRPVIRRYVGVFFFDRAAGRLVQSRLTQETASQLPFQGATMEVTAQSTIITTLTPAPDPPSSEPPGPGPGSPGRPREPNSCRS